MKNFNNKIISNIFSLEEYYLIDENDEFYGMSNNDFIFSNINDLKVRLTFAFEGREKEIIANKNYLKRHFLFIRINYENNYINILINKNSKYNDNQLLEKINKNKLLRGPIFFSLKIKEFPLKNYNLKEINKNYNDKDIYKTYILEKINNKEQINYNNNIMINNNFNQLNNNNLLPKKEKFNIFEINNNNNKAHRLEKLLNEEKIENDQLNKKIKELEKTLSSLIEKNNDLNKKNKELKMGLSRYPFELLDGEKIMSVIFFSQNNNVHFSLICKNTDLFINIEHKLYEEYPDYKNKNNLFTVNGNNINKFQTLEENGIKNSNIILLSEI